MMRELNPKHVEAVIKIINQGPYFRHLSMPVKEIGMGYSIVELDIGNEHLTHLGDFTVESTLQQSIQLLIGPYIVSLTKVLVLISVDLKVDYLAPANRGKMVIKGQRIRIGKKQCVWPKLRIRSK